MYGWCGALEELVDRRLLGDRAAYITSTSSAISATTPRSCVIMMIAVPYSPAAVHQLEDLRLRRHVERGRRLVGDQQVGSLTRAIAIITRWRMPPENWCG